MSTNNQCECGICNCKKNSEEKTKSNYEINKMAENVQVFGEMLRDEVGEYWYNLASIRYNLDMMSPDFKKAWAKEIFDIYDFTTENYEIVDEEVTHTDKVKTLKLKE
jgi:hypothetical protein